jgi:hypothetical protein
MNVKTLGLIAGLALCGSAFAQSEPAQKGQMGEHQEQMGEHHGQMMGQQEKGQKELKGTVVGIQKDDVLVRLDEAPGAIVSLKVDHRTQVDGKPFKKGENIESNLKKDLSPGAEVRASFDLEKTQNKAISIDKQAKK